MKTMKKSIILIMILLIISYISLNAQQISFKPIKKESRIPESAKVIITYATSIVLDAVGDGLYDNGNKIGGKIFQASSVGILLVSPFYIKYDKSKWLTYLTSYTCLRISLFDPSYNLTRGLPLNYIGNTSYWDKGLKKLAPPDGLLAGRGVSFIVGVALPINNLDYPRKTKHYNKNKVFLNDYKY